MPLWRWPKKAVQQSNELTDDELRAALRQQVWSDLSREGGIDPEYREDVASEEDFEALMPEMPLIAVWSERWIDEGLAFSMSVNIERVAATIEKYINRDDPWFHDEYHHIAKEISSSVHSSIVSTMGQTGASPREVCEGLSQLRNI